MPTEATKKTRPKRPVSAPEHAAPPKRAPSRPKKVARGEALALSLVALGASVHRRIALALGELGLTPEQHELLALVDSGLSSPAEIHAASRRDKTTVSRVVSRAAKAGLVAQSRHPKDRRRQVVALTEEGRAALASSRRVVSRAAPRALEPLSPKQRRRLAKIVKKLQAFLDGP